MIYFISFTARIVEPSLGVAGVPLGGAFHCVLLLACTAGKSF